MKKRIIAAPLAVLAALVMVFSTAGPAAATLPNIVKLNVNTTKQAQGNWCWAASIQGIVEYTGNPRPSQCYVDKISHNPDASVCVDETASIAEIQEAMEYLAYPSASQVIWYPTNTQVKTALANGHPMIAVIDWPSPGGAHAVVVDGYRYSHVNVDWLEDGSETTPTAQILMPFTELESTSSSVTYDKVGGGTKTIGAHDLMYIIVQGTWDIDVS